MENNELVDQKITMTKKIFIASGIFLAMLAAVGAALFFISQSKSDKGADKVVIDSTEQLDSKARQFNLDDLGTISSELGFSLKYPFKEVGVTWGDDGKFEVSFFFPPESASADKDMTEALSSDIHNMRISAGMDIIAIEADTNIDILVWIREFLSKEDSRYGNDEKVLSEKYDPITFAGLEGYQIKRQIEGSKGQRSPRYARKEIFVRKGNLVYRIGHLVPSDDTMFARSGAIGKAYLKNVDVLSTEILKTFVFDESISRASISVPKVPMPQIPGEASVNREKLLSVLRAEPFFDKKSVYPILSSRDRCYENNLQNNKNNSANSLQLSPRIHLGASNDVVDIHAYDEFGNHTGSLPSIPTAGFPTPTEERARGIDIINLYSLGNGLSIEKGINGKIELIGKKFSMAHLEINDNGNSCIIAEIDVYFTPYTIATLPITAKGDLGPIQYDIDGDGKKDFDLSLIHPLLPAKQAEFGAVVDDMLRFADEGVLENGIQY